MKSAICCFFFLSAPLFAQAWSDNVAGDALRKRLLSMNLLNPPASPVGRKNIVLAGPTMQPRMCAVPLLKVIPPATSDETRIISPRIYSRGDTVQVPAPPCSETTSTINK